jgi:hypothetical protein
MQSVIIHLHQPKAMRRYVIRKKEKKKKKVEKKSHR